MYATVWWWKSFMCHVYILLVLMLFFLSVSITCPDLYFSEDTLCVTVLQTSTVFSGVTVMVSTLKCGLEGCVFLRFLLHSNVLWSWPRLGCWCSWWIGLLFVASQLIPTACRSSQPQMAAGIFRAGQFWKMCSGSWTPVWQWQSLVVGLNSVSHVGFFSLDWLLSKMVYFNMSSMGRLGSYSQVLSISQMCLLWWCFKIKYLIISSGATVHRPG